MLDPFYAGEWEMDGEAIVAYLSLLNYLNDFPFDDSFRIPKVIKSTELPEPFRTLVNHGLPLTCDFNTKIVLDYLDKTDKGIITPPIPIFEITPICNYQCPWCYIPKVDTEKLSIEVIHRELVIPLLNRGTRIFVLSGGEPSLDLSRLSTICQLIKTESTNIGTQPLITLLTNGYELSSNIELYKKLYISTIQVSLVTIDPELDQQLRKIPKGTNAIEEVCQGTEKAVNEGIGISFNFVLLPEINGMRSNILEIPKIVALAKKLGVYLIRIVPVVPSGKASNNKISLNLKELMLARELISKEIEQSDKEIIVYSPIGYDVAEYKPVYCRAGNDVIYVNAEGWVYPCNNLISQEFRCNKTSIGKEHLLDIWDNSPLLWQFRSPSKVCGDCGRCNMRTECGGQCRAQIYWRTRQTDLSIRPTKCYRVNTSEMEAIM